jgi:hypothetical protein
MPQSVRIVEVRNGSWGIAWPNAPGLFTPPVKDQSSVYAQ